MPVPPELIAAMRARAEYLMEGALDREGASSDSWFGAAHTVDRLAHKSQAVHTVAGAVTAAQRARSTSQTAGERMGAQNVLNILNRA